MSIENLDQLSSTNDSAHTSSRNDDCSKSNEECDPTNHTLPSSAFISDVGCHPTHPINLLNLYHADVFQRNDDTTQQNKRHKKLDESLRVVDFLFGNTIGSRENYHQSSSRLLDGAIQILDQYYLNFTNMNMENVATTSTTSSIKNRRDTSRIDTISRLKSPAGRVLYLVTKGSKSGKKQSANVALDGDGDGDGNSCRQSETSSHYLCMMPDEAPIADSSTTTNSPTLPYCSCRSYLDRNRTLQPHVGDRPVLLCKHLLAIKLLPMLGFAALGNTSATSNIESTIPTMEFASEEDYSRAIIQRLFH